MSRFTLTIDTDNAAFHDEGDWYPGHEVGQLLESVAEAVRADRAPKGVLFDSNGNTVGHYQYTEDES